VIGEVRRNPPVTIEDWPEPDDELDFGEDGEPMDDEHINDADQDPEYVEQHEPLRFHPDDEPGLLNGEVRAWMDLNLGDLADREWIDLCKSAISFYSIF
jgi:hypothetical protein